MKAKIVVLIIAPILFVFAGLALWKLAYPDEGDPKGPRYVLWKAGLVGMNLDIAAQMIAETQIDVDVLVIGKTKAEIVKRFEYLTPASQAAPGYQAILARSSYKERNGMFLRNSRLFVIFKGDTATDAITMK